MGRRLRLTLFVLAACLATVLAAVAPEGASKAQDDDAAPPPWVGDGNVAGGGKGAANKVRLTAARAGWREGLGH